MKKVLVTGASGFIGRNVFERLSSGRRDVEVWGTYHTREFRNPYLIQADLREKSQVQRVLDGVDILIHAAAGSSGAKDILGNPAMHIPGNIVMNTLLLEEAYRRGILHVILLGCSVIYPMNLSHAVCESDFDFERIHPDYSIGALVKIEEEWLARCYAKLGGIKTTVIRHSNCYGPYDKFGSEGAHMLAANIDRVMRAPEGSEIAVWGSGEEIRDLLYISDLLDFIEKALYGGSHTYDNFNVGLGKGYPVKVVVERIIAASGKNLRISFDESKPTIPVSVTLNCRKAQLEYRWSPLVDLDEGIKRTMAWYKQNHTGK